MANLNETDAWPTGIYQIEEDDPVLGGPTGITNTPPTQLAARSRYQRLRNITPWVNTFAYSANAYVSHGGTSWTSIADSTGIAPGTDPSKWVRWGHTASELDDIVEASLRSVQRNEPTYSADIGVANACVVDYAPAVTELTDGMVLWFKAAAANTGATTLNINGRGAKPLIGAAHSALKGGEVLANGRCAVIWNATLAAFVLLSCTGGAMQIPAGSYGVAPPQFDASAKVATMGALQRALGNFSAGQALNASTDLTAAHVGQSIWINGEAAVSIKLPDLGSVASGATLHFWSSNSNPVSINRAGADSILVDSTLRPTLTLGRGDSLHLVAHPAGGIWIAIGGTAQLGFAAAFASLRAPNGYQKLPGGLILQWGTALTSSTADVSVALPIAFPSANFGIYCAPVATGTGVYACINSLGLAYFNLAGWSAASMRNVFNVTWSAVGQ